MDPVFARVLRKSHVPHFNHQLIFENVPKLPEGSPSLVRESHQVRNEPTMEDSNSMWMDIGDGDFTNAIDSFDISESPMELYHSPFHTSDVSQSFSNSTSQSPFQNNRYANVIFFYGFSNQLLVLLIAQPNLTQIILVKRQGRTKSMKNISSP
jgi:hypothetical protein